MTITIVPFTVYPGCEFIAPPSEKERQINKKHLLITYWGIYLNDEYVSYTSSKELAEKTKVWMEKWFKDGL